MILWVGSKNLVQIAQAMQDGLDVQCRQRYLHIAKTPDCQVTEKVPLPLIL
jgi:hypothetical protein